MRRCGVFERKIFHLEYVLGCDNDACEASQTRRKHVCSLWHEFVSLFWKKKKLLCMRYAFVACFVRCKRDIQPATVTVIITQSFSHTNYCKCQFMCTNLNWFSCKNALYHIMGRASGVDRRIRLTCVIVGLIVVPTEIEQNNRTDIVKPYLWRQKKICTKQQKHQQKGDMKNKCVQIKWWDRSSKMQCKHEKFLWFLWLPLMLSVWDCLWEKRYSIC